MASVFAYVPISLSPEWEQQSRTARRRVLRRTLGETTKETSVKYGEGNFESSYGIELTSARDCSTYVTSRVCR